jgi:AcrR family transcriptional regulator
MLAMPRRSAAAVAETRKAVEEVAVNRASIEGLEGLTIGALADEVSMRKSSLFGLFGSKQDLQMATLEAAAELFVDEVWRPVADMRPGRTRLVALCDSWIDFFERGVLPGGCFLTTATVEFDARTGPLHDAVSNAMQRWHELIRREAQIAVDAGELPPDTDPADTAFQLNAFASAASFGFHLSGDREVLDRARRSMRGVLGARPSGSVPA